MEEKLRTWRQQIKKHWAVIQVVAIVLVVTIALIIVGYRFDWTGFNGNNKSGKTLWDWLQLLIIPAMLAIGVFWLNQVQKSREENTTIDNQHEAALQGYLDKMSELLLDEKLNIEKGPVNMLMPVPANVMPTSASRKPSKVDEAIMTSRKNKRMVARARTLTVLSRLDGGRKRTVLQFLFEAGLIDKENPFVDLSGANLSGANLKGVKLSNADLNGTDLSNADLSGADLKGVTGIKLEELEKQAQSLKGATMPDGSIHP